MKSLFALCRRQETGDRKNGNLDEVGVRIVRMIFLPKSCQNTKFLSVLD
ncbi:MAG: hypothetical protein F6K48_34795 [Okeania sp. SIO3H1]|nr:hypothetical protein [Okeania sp. SIO3H1]